VSTGDADAFAELVRRHRLPVFRVAVSILGQGFVHEAEDVTQEVFVRVHRALAAFRGEAQFSSWVYRIAFNQAINTRASLRFRAPHVGEETLLEMASPAPGQFDRLHAKRRAELMDTCLRELPDVYQSSVRLYYWMGASVSEIGELLGAPENTIKSYLHRARRLLGVMLQERGADV
jgi:RNA polymerase sigma-70 factor (ECF subfamily)